MGAATFPMITLFGLLFVAFPVCTVDAYKLDATSAILTAVNRTDNGLPQQQPSQVDPNWWKYTPVYQIYPRSFQDSDGDGVGDLQGIKQRIPYIHDLGVKAIWLSPIYDSPMRDNGYDISNFTDIAPIFGTLDDFKELVGEVHKYGMHLIMDFVPNHSSDQHEWFQRSIRREKPYDEYYVWRDNPNNWLSVFGNSSWEYEPTRGQYYLHQFLIEQPDLNYRNPKLRQEMLNVLRFWVDQGVDGFRIDAVIYLMEDTQFRDEPLSGYNVPPNNYYFLNHIYIQDSMDTYDVVREWTDSLRQYGLANNRHIFTCSEGYTDLSHVMKYYQYGVDFPFNFNLVKWDSTTSASGLRQLIRNWMDNMPTGAWPNWVMGNHDNHRIASRLGGRKYIDIANMLLLLLPGTPTVYNGDEIGMIDAAISYADTRDQSACKWGPRDYAGFSRDPERTPMQWNDSQNAGFTSNSKPWLPMGPDWQTYNVDRQSKDQNSHLSVFKTLVKLRGERVFRTVSAADNLLLVDLGDENVFAFVRAGEAPDANSKYLIILNIGRDGRVSAVKPGSVDSSTTGEVVIGSANADFAVGSKVDLSKPLNLSNAQGYVIKLM